MSLISPEYKKLQEDFHVARSDYGVSSSRHVEPILALAKTLGTRDILDYGCGKCLLQKGLPFPIQNYDPCMPEYAKRPVPATIVICTDVLEHIEPECLKEVMDDLRSLTKEYLFVEVSTKLAVKNLPDGRNAHLIVESANWWLSWLLPRFNLHSFQIQKHAFTAILSVPTAPTAPEVENA